MSEFKFACPVCGQHITADSHAAGSPLECPTCFRQIVVPQAPTSADPKFILSAAEAGRPRPRSAITLPPPPSLKPAPARVAFPLWVVLALIAACAFGAAGFVFRGKVFPCATPEAQAPPAPPGEQPQGGIGLGTWNTEAEYADVVISKGKQTLYRSDFASGMSGWRIHQGSWTGTNGIFRQAAIQANCHATTGQVDWSNYTVNLRARKTGGREGFLIIFNRVDERNWTRWNLGGWGNTQHALQQCVAGRKAFFLGRPVPGRIESGRWYDVRIELAGSRIRCYLDGVLISEVDYASFPPSPPPSPAKVSESTHPSVTGKAR